MQLHQPDIQRELTELNAQILVISFAPVKILSDWLPYFRKHFLERFFKAQRIERPAEFFPQMRFLSDVELAAYHAYGLGRFSIWQAYGPNIIRRYMKFIFQGKLGRLPDGDTLQKGGDFVVNREGRLTLSQVGNDQSERPPIGDILAALKK
ncbi:MAG: hypothetical protein AB1757_25140 [Acidobacteriota bacterium]